MYVFQAVTNRYRFGIVFLNVFFTNAIFGIIPNVPAVNLPFIGTNDSIKWFRFPRFIIYLLKFQGKHFKCFQTTNNGCLQKHRHVELIDRKSSKGNNILVFFPCNRGLWLGKLTAFAKWIWETLYVYF